ncbi:protocatechuate 3,4-dioxygenase subunit beta [Tistrella mobilis]|uniref:protocatechuate 3,4-dioxygenase subunit beta n=1 Tax=Tistrella mobilis TaxID=171437 RepID=UPI003557FCD5
MTGEISPRDWSAQPPYLAPDYKSTLLRAPSKPLIPIPHGLMEAAAPVFGQDAVGPLDHDLTRNGRVNGEPLGERIVVTGRVLDDVGRPVPGTLVEVWQANAAGRYVHVADAHDAPLDPNFTGAGRVVTDQDGRYSFITVKPGAYPWRNHPNAWRPNHIHLSLFGRSFASRLVTQMYFPGDPLLALDPIFQATADAGARDRLVARFDIGVTQPEFALGYVFDIVLRGAMATPMED